MLIFFFLFIQKQNELMYIITYDLLFGQVNVRSLASCLFSHHGSKYFLVLYASKLIPFISCNHEALHFCMSVFVTASHGIAVFSFYLSY